MGGGVRKSTSNMIDHGKAVGWLPCRLCGILLVGQPLMTLRPISTTTGNNIVFIEKNPLCVINTVLLIRISSLS